MGSGRLHRLGVAAAVVEGVVVHGDVVIDADLGVVAEIGRSPAGRGLAHPGLVDLQVNGFAGSDLRSATPEAVGEVAAQLAAVGATAFQPTLHSAPVATYLEGLARLDEARRRQRDDHDARRPSGARILGAHLEGPFLSTEWAGAHDPALLLPIRTALVADLLDAGEVAMVTLAPELDGATELVVELRERGVVASIGHTGADAATVTRAVDAGAVHVTHCWNAHRRFTPRDPGPAGVALSDGRVTVGLIADLVHVAPETVRLTLAAAAGRVAVTADAVAAAHDPGATVTGPVEPGGRPDGGDGPLRGGSCSPVEVLGRLRSLGLGWDVTAAACAATPARVAGLSARTLAPGTVADVVVLDDRLEVVRTLVAGTEVAAAG